MIAITDKLHVALQQLCGQLPAQDVEQLLLALRQGIPIPESVAKKLRANPLACEIEVLEKRLADLKSRAEADTEGAQVVTLGGEDIG